MKNNTINISNQPPRGTSDWFSDEFQIRKYIFDTWRKTCINFGYEEYLTPLFENSLLYKAKSGEDIGGKELTTFMGKSGKEYAIRPEMTPSVTRLVSKIYNARQKPIRLFSIANFVRNERPQKGRNREFWQLNYDIFGIEETSADLEVLIISAEIMKAFRPPKDAFKIFLNHRKLIDFVLDDLCKINPKTKIFITRLMDKWKKLSSSQFKEELFKLNLAQKQADFIINFLIAENREDLIKKIPEIKNSEGFKEITKLSEDLKSLGYDEYFEFKSDIIRGFDYYDGLVFEVFDTNKDNSRSLFGGGRYNGLANIFGQNEFPAVGSAPGDETTKLFLENWNLVRDILKKAKERIYYLPLIAKEKTMETLKLAQNLRKEGVNIATGLKPQNIKKATQHANKSRMDGIIYYGDDEISKNKYKVKDLKSGEEEEYKLDD